MSIKGILFFWWFVSSILIIAMALAFVSFFHYNLLFYLLYILFWVLAFYIVERKNERELKKL